VEVHGENARLRLPWDANRSGFGRRALARVLRSERNLRVAERVFDHPGKLLWREAPADLVRRAEAFWSCSEKEQKTLGLISPGGEVEEPEWKGGVSFSFTWPSPQSAGVSERFLEEHSLDLARKLLSLGGPAVFTRKGPVVLGRREDAFLMLYVGFKPIIPLSPSPRLSAAALWTLENRTGYYVGELKSPGALVREENGEYHVLAADTTSAREASEALAGWAARWRLKVRAATYGPEGKKLKKMVKDVFEKHGLQPTAVRATPGLKPPYLVPWAFREILA